MCTSSEHESDTTRRHAAERRTFAAVNWTLTASRVARELLGWAGIFHR